MALTSEQHQEWMANPDLRQLAQTVGVDPSYAVQGALAATAPAQAAVQSAIQAVLQGTSPKSFAVPQAANQETQSTAILNAPTPQMTATPTQAAATTGAFDPAAYLAANKDLAKYAAANGLDPLQFATDHYNSTGQYEIAQGKRGGAPAAASTAPVAHTPGYQQITGSFGIDPSQVPMPTAEDFGMYVNAMPKAQMAQLSPADPSRGFSTPYYSTYTDDGDFAGAVMAAPGQKIRIVDNKTGQVVFEGEGPEGAQQAATIANAASNSIGKKASWTIQADYGDQGWKGQAEDLKDTKHNLLGTLLDIAAPFILAAVFPPLAGVAGALGATGAAATVGNAAILGALANTGSGLIQGESLGNAVKGGLTSGAISGLGAGILGALPSGITNPINHALSTIQGGFNSAVDAIPGLHYALDPINNGLTNILDGAGNVIGTVRGGIQDAKAAVQTAIGLKQPAPTFTPNTDYGIDLSQLAGAVSPLTVMPSVGTPTFGVPTPGGLTPAGPGNEVSPVDVIAQQQQQQPSTPTTSTGNVDPTAPVDLSGVTVTAPHQPTDFGVPTVPVVTPEDITPPLSDGGNITPPANPTQPGVPASGGSVGGKYSINSAAGTRASLDPIFTAQLPAPTFGTRTPMAASVDNRYAIEHPEAKFFSNVVQPSTADFSVLSPSAVLAQGIGDLDGDGQITAHDRELWRQQFGARGYKTGGYAVGGPGDGRSDSIPARLSDGEYVIDAETVAMLGNGSSKAGAKKLDSFRVNIRKHKGRNLAKGKFSVDAKTPEAYLNA